MKRFDHYSDEAMRLFSALNMGEIVVNEQCSEIMPRHSWMHLGRSTDEDIDNSGVFIPLRHGGEESAGVAARLIMRKPDFIYTGVEKLTAPQAIEVKARAMLMGDIVMHFSDMAHDGLLPPLREGEDWLVTIRNPYWFMVNDVLRIAEEKHPELPKVRDRLPAKCRVLVTDGIKKAPQETYAVRIRIGEDAEFLTDGRIKRPENAYSSVDVGVALVDAPWITAFDVSGVGF